MAASGSASGAPDRASLMLSDASWPPFAAKLHETLRA